MNRKLLLFSISAILILSSCSSSRYGYIGRYKETKQESSSETKNDESHTRNEIAVLAEAPESEAEEAEYRSMEEAAIPAIQSSTNKKSLKPILRKKHMLSIAEAPEKELGKKTNEPGHSKIETDDDGSCCAGFIALIGIAVLVYIILNVLGVSVSLTVVLFVILTLILLGILFRMSR